MNNTALYDLSFATIASGESAIRPFLDLKWDSYSSYVVVSFLMLAAAGVKLLYHITPTLNENIPESCVLIALGIFISLASHSIDSAHISIYTQMDLTSNIFFNFLLPPIILESAYTLHDPIFFANIGTIILYAVMGTILNIFLIAPSLYFCNVWGFFGDLQLKLIESFIFSTLIAAVDPVAVLAIFQEVNVNKALYFLLFGESLFNDAVVITLYNLISDMSKSETMSGLEIINGFLSFTKVSSGGFVFGLAFGFLTAFLTKFTYNVRVVEPLFTLMFAYSSYICAEMFHFSGIISLTCCGLVQKGYVQHNISKKSYTTIMYMTKTLSSISEVIIFLFLGQIMMRDDHVWNSSFVFFTIIFCIVYRFVAVFSLTYFANSFFRRVRIVNFEEQILMAYGGLRGAIAFSLVQLLDKEDHDKVGYDNLIIKQTRLYLTTTLFVILFSVLVLGATTKPIVKMLKVKIQAKEEINLFLEVNNRVMASVLGCVEELIDQKSFNYWRKKLDELTNQYIKPFMVRNLVDEATEIKATYERMYREHIRHSATDSLKPQLDQPERELYPDVNKFIELEEFLTSDMNLDIKKINKYKKIFDAPIEQIELKEIIKTTIIPNSIYESVICEDSLLDSENESSYKKEIIRKWKGNQYFAGLFQRKRNFIENEPARVTAKEKNLTKLTGKKVVK